MLATLRYERPVEPSKLERRYFDADWRCRNGATLYASNCKPATAMMVVAAAQAFFARDDLY